jgi:hypothetical protein
MNVASIVPLRWLALALLLVSSPGWLCDQARAADIRESTSLKFAPDNVAFYGMKLRMKEQYEAFVNSQAFTTLSELPLVKMGFGFLTMMWNNPSDERIAALQAALQQEENKQAVAVILDALSQEFFVFGGEGYGDLIRFANELNAAQREAQIAALRGEGSNEEILVEKLLEKVTAALDKAKLPFTVLGFRVSDVDRAQTQLARLEKLLQQVLAQQPELASRLTRENVGGADYLTLKLDGTLIPWEQVYDQAGDKREQVEKLAEKVKGVKLVLSVGLWNGYLIVSSGESTEHLKQLGKGPLLVDRKEMKPLAAHFGKRVAGVGYASAEFLRTINSMEQQLNELVSYSEQLVPMAELDEEVEKEMLSDVRELANSLQTHLPKPGASSGISFLTDRGFEGFSYAWGENRTVDASQPLTILQHAGGTPVFVGATRGKYDPRCYDALAKYVGKAIYYGEKIALKDADDDQRKQYEQARDALLPLLKRLGDVTRDVMMPALKDGQIALTMDTESTSSQWHMAMPAAQQALPMLEMALVCGVSDAEAVKKATGEYFAIVQEMLDKLHEIRPDDVPEIKLPTPESKQFAAGSVYYYRLPQQAGLDRQIAPSAGLSDEVLAMSLVPRQLQRVLETAPLKLDGPVGNLDRPLAAATHLDLAALLSAVSPWVDYGFTLASQSEGGNAVGAFQPQVQTVLKVLQCIRRVTAVTYQEGDALATHFEVNVQDM